MNFIPNKTNNEKNLIYTHVYEPTINPCIASLIDLYQKKKIIIISLSLRLIFMCLDIVKHSKNFFHYEIQENCELQWNGVVLQGRIPHGL